MTSTFEDIDRIDRLVHEPARLVILTALASCASADFVFLQRITGLTTGNLSAHLAKLQEARFVKIEKRFIKNRPNTRIVLTADGRRAVDEHWRRLEQLRYEASALKPGVS
jgi:DNA-binding MarR family transcriptional regulator